MGHESSRSSKPNTNAPFELTKTKYPGPQGGLRNKNVEFSVSVLRCIYSCSLFNMFISGYSSNREGRDLYIFSIIDKLEKYHVIEILWRLSDKWSTKIRDRLKWKRHTRLESIREESTQMLCEVFCEGFKNYFSTLYPNQTPYEVLMVLYCLHVKYKRSLPSDHGMFMSVPREFNPGHCTGPNASPQEERTHSFLGSGNMFLGNPEELNVFTSQPEDWNPFEDRKHDFESYLISLCDAETDSFHIESVFGSFSSSLKQWKKDYDKSTSNEDELQVDPAVTKTDDVISHGLLSTTIQKLFSACPDKSKISLKQFITMIQIALNIELTSEGKKFTKKQLTLLNTEDSTTSYKNDTQECGLDTNDSPGKAETQEPKDSISNDKADDEIACMLEDSSCSEEKDERSEVKDSTTSHKNDTQEGGLDTKDSPGRANLQVPKDSISNDKADDEIACMEDVTDTSAQTLDTNTDKEKKKGKQTMSGKRNQKRRRQEDHNLPVRKSARLQKLSTEPVLEKWDLPDLRRMWSYFTNATLAKPGTIHTINDADEKKKYESYRMSDSSYTEKEDKVQMMLSLITKKSEKGLTEDESALLVGIIHDFGNSTSNCIMSKENQKELLNRHYHGLLLEKCLEKFKEKEDNTDVFQH